MPNITSVVITDGTTPVTLKPDSMSGSTSVFVSSNKATRSAQTLLKVTTSQNAQASRVIVKLDEPVSYVNADTGRTEVSEHSISDVNIRIPLELTIAERTAFVKKTFSYLADATLAAVIKDGERLW